MLHVRPAELHVPREFNMEAADGYLSCEHEHSVNHSKQGENTTTRLKLRMCDELQTDDPMHETIRLRLEDSYHGSRSRIELCCSCVDEQLRLGYG